MFEKSLLENLKRTLDNFEYEKTQFLPVPGEGLNLKAKDEFLNLMKMELSYPNTLFSTFYYNNFRRKYPEAFRLFHLFFLMEEVNMKKIVDLTGPNLFKNLVKSGFIVLDGEEARSKFTIVSFKGRYFISDNRLAKEKPKYHVYSGLSGIFLLESLSDLETSKADLLDFGTGNGILTISLFTKNNHLLGIDINKRAIEIAKANLVLNGLKYNNIKFATGSSLKYFKNKFDCIIANLPFSPTPDERLPVYAFSGKAGYSPFEKLLKNANHLLKPGGFLCGTVGSLTESGEPVISNFLRKIKISPMTIKLKEILVLSLKEHVKGLFDFDVNEKLKNEKIHVYTFIARLSDKFDISIEKLPESVILYKDVKKKLYKLLIKPMRRVNLWGFFD